MKNIATFIVCLSALVSGCTDRGGSRSETSLNGKWEIARTGSFNDLPESFSSVVAVPGLVDMAVQPVESADSYYNDAVYWYRRFIDSPDTNRELIYLKINKSQYHTKLFINRIPAGDNVYSFTPSNFDIKPFLNPNGGKCEILIAVGSRNTLPDTVTNGWDFEKIKYIPGIYDDVKLIEAGYPYINNIQTVPLIGEGKLRIIAELLPGKERNPGGKYVIRQISDRAIVAEGRFKAVNNFTNKIAFADFTAEIESPHLWSPEDPFMYELEISSSGDSKRVKFGMRSFSTDVEKRLFLLNGRPYYLRGTNVCIYRFFEDPDRKGLPWNSEWITGLHLKFKDMGWQSIRYCIGFPPERWYEIADSLGFLIQDEYPLWTLGKENYEKYLGNLNEKQLATEYREWMRERWNHPCVVVWDAQNESVTEVTAKAINLVRDLDLSHRPWDNGWAAPASVSDAIESHPYLFSRYMNSKPGKEGYLKELLSEARLPFNDPNERVPLAGGKRYENPVILNEYGWIWLNRDGSPTTLTDKVYENVWPWVKTPEQRLEIYAKTLGILTEYWRAHRHAAGVMHFCGLGYSRPGEPRGQTSDHFIDLEKLTYEANFYKYVRPAFSPVGVMIDFWAQSCKGDSELTVPVSIINDTYETYRDSLRLSVSCNNLIVNKITEAIELESLGRQVMEFKVMMPGIKGKCSIEAYLMYNNEKVKSLREVEIK